jgi:hypothetical protein
VRPGRRSSSSLTRLLVKSGGERHWRRRTAWNRRWLRLQWVSARVRGSSSGAGGPGRFLFGWVAVNVLVPCVFFVLVEVISAKTGSHLARHGGVGRLWRSLAPDRYETLVGVIASIGGVLLALYFTTVGVVASNTYSSVPGRLRQLFLRERTGSWYIRLLAWTVSLSVVVLGCRAVGYQPHAVTIALLVVAAVVAVFMLAVLGSRLFVFFDLTTLATPLPWRWRRIMRSASRYGRHRRFELATRGFWGRQTERVLGDEQADGRPVTDSALDSSAQVILDTYREIATVLETGENSELRPLTGLGMNLVTCWWQYAAAKSAIPTRSHFYRKRYEYPNVLTADQSSRTMALATRTFVQPTLGPDRLWIERDLADLLDVLLRRLLADPDWSEALRLLGTVCDLASSLAGEGQMAEAMLLWHRITAQFWDALTREPSGSGRIRTPGERLAYQLAAANMVAMTLVQIWLAVVQIAEGLSPGSLQDVVTKALGLPVRPEAADATEPPTRGTTADRGMNRGLAAWAWLRRRPGLLARRYQDSRALRWDGIYALGAPHLLLERLEIIASRLDVERFAERHPVTPGWWAADHAGQVTTRVISEAAEQVINAIQDFHVTQTEKAGDLPAPVKAQLTLAGLEALHKVRFHLPAIQKAIKALHELRHPAAGQQWPTVLDVGHRGNTADMVTRRLETRLGELLGDLPAEAHDPGRPDFYGQAYIVLFDVVFETILTGDDEHATALFPALFSGAWLANIRLIEDLALRPTDQRALFGTEPLVDVMALSGYARLFTSIHGHGIWEQVRSSWDRLLSTAKDPHAVVRQLILSLGLRENLFMLTTGGVLRTQLRMRADQAMAAAGLTSMASPWPDDIDYDEPGEDDSDLAGQTDPVVAAFASGGIVHPDAEVVFAAVYLRHRPEAAGVELPREVERLAERIDDLSPQKEPDNPGPETSGPPSAAESEDGEEAPGPDEQGGMQ